MSTNYEITEINPQQLRMQVKYSKTDKPDYWENIKVMDFSDDALHKIAKERARRAETFWEQIESAPADKTLELNTGELKPKTYTDAPDFDPFTQTLVESWNETETEEVQSWSVVEKTDEEKAQVISEWRSTTQVTMRQARLALVDQGLLSQVQDAIALIPEPDKSKIETEWEYASTVERGSVWVSVLQPALGLTDEQMDDLFKLALTL